MAINAATPGKIKGTSITAPSASGDNHSLVLGQLKETTEIAQRLRGDPNDSFVRVSEINSALGTRMVNNTLQPPNSSNTSAGGTVSVADSIVGDGSSGSPLALDGDAATPGNNMQYATNGSGVKGWYAAGGGGSSPLTTKGDIFGFSTTSARIPVGSDGKVLTADSTAALGVSYQTPGGGSVALPGTIPDLQFWWESDDILGATGSPVYRLRERTPWITGIAASQSPSIVVIDSTQLNSKNVLAFPGGSSTGSFNLQTPLLFPSGATFFVVIKGTVSGTQAIIAGVSGSLSLYLQSGSGSALQLVNDGIALIGTSTVPWTSGVFFQANATYEPVSGNFAFRQSSAPAGSGTGPTGSGTANATNLIGTDTFSSLLKASAALIIMFARVLTAPEIAAMEAYILATWGV